MKFMEQKGGVLRETRMGDEEIASCECCKKHPPKHRLEIVRCKECHMACTCVCHENDQPGIA